MKSFIMFLLLLVTVFSLSLNFVLWTEIEKCRAEINRLVMPVGDDELNKLIEEIKKLTQDINAGNDT